MLDAKYISQTDVKKTFNVSMQHYTFAVNAFVELVKQYGMDEYEFEVHETKTYEVIENVKNNKSEIGILYLNDFNKSVGSISGKQDLAQTKWNILSYIKRGCGLTVAKSSESVEEVFRGLMWHVLGAC